MAPALSGLLRGKWGVHNNSRKEFGVPGWPGWRTPIYRTLQPFLHKLQAALLLRLITAAIHLSFCCLQRWLDGLFACLIEYRWDPGGQHQARKVEFPTHRHRSRARTGAVSLPTDPFNPQSLNPPQHKTEECAEGSTKPGRLSGLAHERRRSELSRKAERGYITLGTFDDLNYRQSLKAFPKSSLEMLRDKTVELTDVCFAGDWEQR